MTTLSYTPHLLPVTWQPVPLLLFLSASFHFQIHPSKETSAWSQACCSFAPPSHWPPFPVIHWKLTDWSRGSLEAGSLLHLHRSTLVPAALSEPSNEIYDHFCSFWKGLPGNVGASLILYQLLKMG